MTRAAGTNTGATVRLLCAADIHLGRQPSRLPAALLEGSSARSLSPSAAWERLVETAIDQRVDAVVLAGDVVEESDDFYEAYADLRSGVERLAAAAIPVVGVAGNHDLQVLPRLVRAVPEFTLLGEGGVWESLVVEGDGGARVRLHGWSFPNDLAGNRPLAKPLPPRGNEPTIGVLHCDRDGTVDRYAPVRSGDLQAAEVDAWLLGHIHKPDRLRGERPIGYLGSLTGMDPGEQGPRGAWLLEVTAGGGLSMRHLPLAPLRWEQLALAVDELTDPDEVHTLIASAVDTLHQELTAAPQRPSAVGLRLVLSGRSRLGEGLRRSLQAADPRAEPMHRGQGISYFVHDLRLEVLPAVDLERLARGGDPAGLLAARLLLIRGEGDAGERRELLRGARERLDPLARRRQFRPLAEGSPSDGQLSDGQLSDGQLAEILEAAALRALDALLAQQEAEA